MSRLLLLEDDIGLIDGLKYSLKKNGFELCVVRSVREAMEQIQCLDNYDLLLLDIALPDGTGFEVCERVRRDNSSIPIIFLTAADEEVNIIRGLDGGGDDYITKPFKLGELCSRIRALLRRSTVNKKESQMLSSGDLTIDFIGNKVYLSGKVLELTGAEYRLLCLLVRHSGQILPRSTIMDALWDGNGSFVDDNTLSVYVRRLRKKLEEDTCQPKRLLTVRGIGYQWDE